MFIEPVTEYELQIEINNLNENKSAGHDEISAKMIKKISENIIKPLTYIYNLSFQTGKIPNFLTLAIISAIYKANENNLFENYRPISVLTCFIRTKILTDYITMLRNTKYFQNINLVLEGIYQLNMPFLS
jgi:hypothetical protein